MKYLLFAFCIFTLIACGNDDDTTMEEEEVTCPSEIDPTFSITITNTSTGAPVEDVTITVMDDTFTSVLNEVSPGVYEGPNERAGSYQIRIEKTGFQTIITAEITPGEDECGLVTEVLEFELEEM